MHDNARASYIGGEATISETSQVDRLTLDLRGALEEQQKTLALLQERLRPLLRPLDIKLAANTPEERPVCSPLVDEWSGFLRQVQSTTRQLHQILNELEV